MNLKKIFLTQVFIVLSTGKISKTQIISLVTSVLSLSWGASRAFLVMRTAGKADPDPELTTVALRIWPLMLVITITNLVCLVYIAGLSGGYVFIAISVNFLTTYVVLWKTIKVTEKGDSRERKEQVPKEEIPRLAIENETEDNEESENAGIEMSPLAAGTSKDFEGQELEQQAQAKPDDEKEAGGVQVPTPTEMPNMATGTSEDVEDQEEADEAQMPPSTELPGAGKDIESQEEEQQSEASSEEKAKEEE